MPFTQICAENQIQLEKVLQMQVGPTVQVIFVPLHKPSLHQSFVVQGLESSHDLSAKDQAWGEEELQIYLK